MIELILATRNSHKTRELRGLLGRDFNLIDCAALPEIAMPAETGGTLYENAILKAVGVSKESQLQERHPLIVADDSGLEVDALGGKPGVHSARYAGEGATDERNIEKLLSELRDRNIVAKKRTARFRCVLTLAQNGKLVCAFGGTIEGVIVDPPRGNSGFGYDPVFQPNGFAETFAEMAPELKNRISHRAKAAAALREKLRQLRT